MSAKRRKIRAQVKSLERSKVGYPPSLIRRLKRARTSGTPEEVATCYIETQGHLFRWYLGRRIELDILYGRSWPLRDVSRPRMTTSSISGLP